MKRLSLKTRLALFYTGLMTLVLGLVLGVLFSVSSQEILTGVQNTLEERVSSSIEDVEFRQGRLEFDSELLSLENGVYLSVYQPGDFSLLYGRLPYGFAYDLAFSDGELRAVSAGEAEYYVLDLEFPVEGYGDLVLRGVVSLSDAERDFRFTLRLALILFPLLIALTALCGYLLSRRALGPVAQITQTVRNIQRERDLSKRVRLGEGRDEIYTLAQTFDSLLDQLEAGFQREKQFTSDVAHELRTPLAVALMQGEALLAEVASRRQITLEADIQPGVSVVADQTLLLRLWGNLLQNAVTYGKEGGHIWMKLTVEESWAVLRVRDDGIGISPEQLPKIWDRFFQADPSRSGDSSGLGLSMVQWIAAAHGGRASAESKLGEGSVFTVRLPLSGPEEKAGRHGP